jgi:Fe-Mn family superoxide dismutase
VAPGKISEELSKQIESDFESFEALRKELTNAAAKRFGSGWAWLILMPDKTLKVTSSANQDNPIMDVSEIRGIPILGIDVWEHAYYLRYQNKRGDYLSAIWSLLDWGLISEKYKEALKDPLLKRIN